MIKYGYMLYKDMGTPRTLSTYTRLHYAVSVESGSFFIVCYNLVADRKEFTL